MDFFIRNAFAQRLGDDPDAAVIHHRQLPQQFIPIQSGEIIGQQAVHMLLQRADGFHQRPLEVGADAHDLTGGFHLGAQRPLGRQEFVEGQTGHFYHTVVQHGLKAGKGLFRDGVWNLVQMIAQGDLGRHLGDGVAGGLTCQRGRTADTGIHLDDAVLKAGGMQGKLYVTAAGDVQLADDIQRRASQHLVLLIPQRLRRRRHDAVTGMYAHRIQIFHITNGNACAVGVPHHLILDFLPARNAALHQDLAHTAQPQAVGENLFQLHRVVGDTAAAAAQRIGRTQHHRVTDLCRKGSALFHRIHDLGRGTGLSDLFHGFLEKLPVLRLADRLRRGADEGNAVGLQKSRLCQLHGQVQRRLAAQGGKHAVRFFL